MIKREVLFKWCFFFLFFKKKNMKIELKEIIDELTNALDLPSGEKVAALIENDKLVGWTIVNVYENGTIKPTSEKKFKNIKELISENKH